MARAEAAVNRLAGALKEGVQRALNLLGSALNAALGLLERGMLAAVDAASRTVQGAIQSGRSVVQGFAAFAALIRDIAANPGQWIRNLGAAVVDGIRNHLWAALKTAIKEWFNSKVEEVLGLGMAVWQLLGRGGIAVAQVGRMVWEGLKQVIPITLIQILVQRLVAMIVPALGAVMAIIETLLAAWGTVSRIIQAFERFFAFLRAVKTGNAGPQFAQALAAAAVAVIDFASNFLLMRLRRPAGALAGRIRAIAQRIGQRLRRITQGIGRRFRRFGRGLRGGVRGLRASFQRRGSRQPMSMAERRAERERQRSQQARDRLNRAVRELGPRITALAQRGVTGLRLHAQLALWRVTYRLRRLYVQRRDANYVAIRAQVNPDEPVTQVRIPSGERLRQMIRDVAEQILQRRDVGEVADWMRSSGTGRLAQNPTEMVGGLGFPAVVRRYREDLLHSRAGVAAGGEAATNLQLYTRITPEVTTREWQQFAHRANAFVHGAADYPALARDLQRMMGQTGMSEREMADAFRETARTGEIPGHLDYRAKETNAAAQLMFVREAVRDPATIATTPMMLMQVRRGEMTFDEAFAQFEGGSFGRSGGGGAFPMSMQREGKRPGAEQAAEELQREREMMGRGETSPRRSEEAQELARREIELAERWLMAEMIAERLRAFTGEEHAREFIMRKILEFYEIPHAAASVHRRITPWEINMRKIMADGATGQGNQ